MSDEKWVSGETACEDEKSIAQQGPDWCSNVQRTLGLGECVCHCCPRQVLGKSICSQTAQPASGTVSAWFFVYISAVTGERETGILYQA